MLANAETAKRIPAVWVARIAVGIVLVLNGWCAFVFIFDADAYAPGFELGGLPGRIVVQGVGILFLMWNATYPLVLLDPIKHNAMFAVVLTQQIIGVLGETWLVFTLPEGHAALEATGMRFILFDGGGLIAMGIAYAALNRHPRKTVSG